MTVKKVAALMSPLLKKASAAYQSGRFAEVIATLEPAAVGGKLADPGLLAMLAQAEAKSGRLDRAALWFGKAGLLKGPNRKMLLELSVSLYRRLLEEQNLLNWDGFTVAKALVALDPAHRDATVFYRYAMHYLGALTDIDAYNRRVYPLLKAGDPFYRSVEVLLNHLIWCPDEAVNASMLTNLSGPPYTAESRAARRARPHVFGEKIRIGYLTADLLHDHATVILFRGVLDHHDPERFEVTLYCNTPGPFSAADQAFRAGLERLVPIRHLSTEEAVERIRADGIDILVDMKGHTIGGRMDVVNAGPAPLQVAWLGFPGSGNGIDCDYVVGDRIVLPDHAAEHYHEVFCRLPESYQSNDHRHRPRPVPLSRAELGLPEDLLVFASFNSILKTSPEIVRLWARILKGTPGSALALICGTAMQQANFVAAMAREGIEEERIFFTDKVPYAAHLARIPVADLCLDTYPCNGHTTTSDMLWAGVPVVTMKGSHFASRVSESLLGALGLDELVAPDAEGYVALALALAANRPRRLALREKIAAARFTAPLFDTERFTRHLATGCAMMVERARAGLPPAPIDVPALPAREGAFA